MSCGAFGMPSILSATFPSLNSMIVGSASTLYFEAMLGYFSVFIFCVGGRRRVVLACEAVFARETCWWELFCRLFGFWFSDERGGGGWKGGKGGGGTTQTENGIDGDPPPASPCPCPRPPRLWARRRARASGTARTTWRRSPRARARAIARSCRRKTRTFPSSRESRTHPRDASNRQIFSVGGVRARRRRGFAGRGSRRARARSRRLRRGRGTPSRWETGGSLALEGALGRRRAWRSESRFRHSSKFRS